MRSVFGLLVLLCVAAGCSPTHLALRGDAPEAVAALPLDLASRFAYEPGAPSVTSEVVLSEADFEKHAARFEAPCPVTGERRTVRFEWWRSLRGAGPRPLMAIIPILAGRYPECDHLGRLFAREGMHAFFVHREDNLLEWKEGAEPFETKLRRSIVNVRRVLDWFAARPDVDMRSAGLVGISMGAIAGTFAMAAEPRFRAGVLIMGGGDLPHVMATSLESPVRRYRTSWLRATGGDLAGFQAHVRERLPSDPLHFAPFIGPRRILQLVARYDNRVPTADQWKLHEALGRPEAYDVPCGHYTGILYLGFAEEAALRFLRSRLELPRVEGVGLARR